MDGLDTSRRPSTTPAARQDSPTCSMANACNVRMSNHPPTPPTAHTQAKAPARHGR